MYKQNRDLILISVFGFIYYAIVIGLNGHLTRVPLGHYFLVPFFVAVFMSFSIQRSSQIIEWPLCFLFGGTIASSTLIVVLSLLGMQFTLYDVAYTLSQTFAWFGTVSAMMMIGILAGTFLKATYNLVMGSLAINFE